MIIEKKWRAEARSRVWAKDGIDCPRVRPPDGRGHPGVSGLCQRGAEVGAGVPGAGVIRPPNCKLCLVTKALEIPHCVRDDRLPPEEVVQKVNQIPGNLKEGHQISRFDLPPDPLLYSLNW